MVLLVMVGAVAWEAIKRLSEPTQVGETTVIWVAAIGILVNGITALLFMAGREHDFPERRPAL